jgi:serine protease Do
MKAMTKGLVFCALAIGSGISILVGSNLVQNVQFTRAMQEVDEARSALSRVEDLAAVFRNVGKVIEPSVVNIQVTRPAGRARSPQEDELFRRFFPDRDGDGQPDVPPDMAFPDATTEGSGVIVDVENGAGWIVTNNHVIAGATEIRVTLSDGRDISDVRLVGTDPKTDLAVLRIKADRLIAAKWGDSDTLQKGDIIFAFGSPLGYIGSMTQGIVSATNRSAGVIRSEFAYENFIQVDAPINPGNSGGPLVNLRGQVVGINTAIATRSGGFQGIGFAIPSTQVKFVYDQLRSSGRVTRGWLGVRIGDVTTAAIRDAARAVGFMGDKGVFVEQVIRDTPSAGVLMSGDVITSINDVQVDSMNALRKEIATMRPGTEVKLRVFRSGKEQDVVVKLGEQPDDTLAMAQTRQGTQPPPAATAGALGLRLGDVNSDSITRFGLPAGTRGALITAVDGAGLGARFGLRPGDVITRIGDVEVSDAARSGELLSKQDLSAGVPIHITNREGSRFVFVRAR